MIYGVFYCLQKSEVFRNFLQVFRNWPIVVCRNGLQDPLLPVTKGRKRPILLKKSVLPDCPCTGC